MNRRMTRTRIIFISLLMILLGHAIHAEDPYRLWLRYDPLPKDVVAVNQELIRSVMVSGESPTLQIIREELVRACSSMTGAEVLNVHDLSADGTVIAGTPETSEIIAELGWANSLAELGPEGYRIAQVTLDGHEVTVIASEGEIGVLYGTYHLLRLVHNGRHLRGIDIAEKPRFDLRVLNHWDNLNRSVERGYAGRSLWNWEELPDTVDDRLRDYARANASLGLNMSVLNNVNANATILTPEYLKKVTAIADTFRPYGIRVCLSARFSAPMEIGGLQTADPLNADVQDWWKKKAEEIYGLIPNFGGFLVKANSEGQPGPDEYGRTHAEGANMLAAALEPHDGVVMWRAFVYDMKPGYDRAGAAYERMKPLDGQFADNVFLQCKNGPIDFQPREPFQPLFGGMLHTQVMPELQIAQEYMGQSNSIAYLAPMWREFFDADTHAEGSGSLVVDTVDGTLNDAKLTAIAAVANTGTDRDWCGHIFSQANWYAYGRLAWNPRLSSKVIAEEWTTLTWTHDRKVRDKIVRILEESREAAVDAMDPLGLTHIFSANAHYGPGPWVEGMPRADWNSTFYHRATKEGIGFDRTETGSGSLSQYHEPVQALFGDPASCPPEFLLWFHHLPWNWMIPSLDRSIWEELCFRYQHGADWPKETKAIWETLAPHVDTERHAMVMTELDLQIRDTTLWKNACLSYFQTFSEMPFPAGVVPPDQTLENYKRIRLRHE